MKVKQLIARLKKMPQNTEVFTACHDNSEFETSGCVDNVWLLNKEDFDPVANHTDLHVDHMPDQWVTLR